MAEVRPKRFRWLIALAVLALVAGGFWYAHARGWLDSVYAWVGLASMHQASGPGEDEMEDMPGMPGMKMPKRGGKETKSDVPGYSKVSISAGIQQRIGVKIGKVVEEPLRMSVRTVGIVRPDETKMTRIQLRTEGWVDKLFVNFEGQKVKKGDALLSIYSPQFLTTQQEYLGASEAGNRPLADLARWRLELWGISPKEIKELETTKAAQKNLTLRSPLTGTVLTKKVMEKEYITPTTELYTMADLSTVWVQAKVYEYELPHVELGQPASVTVPGLPEQMFPGKVVFVQPTVDEATRTVQVRVELPNPDGLFKPGMFAHIEIKHAMGKGLQVPTSAVMRTGERDIVFRADADDRFVPVEVKVSPLRFEGNRFHVLEGLKAGDHVVTSANFLIDSESRLRLGGMPGMDMGDMKGMDHSKMKH